jgi:hypothetical protein
MQYHQRDVIRDSSPSSSKKKSPRTSGMIQRRKFHVTSVNRGPSLEASKVDRYLTLSTPYIPTTTLAPHCTLNTAMGNSASRASKAAGSAARKYPTRPPTNTTTRAPAPSAPARASNFGPTVHPPPQATETKTQGTWDLSGPL